MNQFAIWTRRVSGAVILGIVVFLYAQALATGTWPPSHPWSGLALSLAAAQMLWMTHSSYREIPPKRRNLITIPIAILTLLAALLWLLSAVRS